MRRQRIIVACLSLATMACCNGCGDKHAGIVPVSGTVTIDGKPIPAGQVRVLANGQRPAMGRIQKDGSFKLSSFDLNDGAPVGTHLATISAVESINERSNRWFAPKEYANKVSSGVWVTIDGPTDDLNIELSWAGSKQSKAFIEKF